MVLKSVSFQDPPITRSKKAPFRVDQSHGLAIHRTAGEIYNRVRLHKRRRTAHALTNQHPFVILRCASQARSELDVSIRLINRGNTGTH